MDAVGSPNGRAGDPYTRVKYLLDPALLIALCSAGLSLALIMHFWRPQDGFYIGNRLYDVYFMALRDGRFDLPMRELRYEGHYAPDGTGYLYHGLAPLLTRLLFAPFVDLPTSWICPLSIWFWAMIGNICSHRAFSLALSVVRVDEPWKREGARTIIALMIWGSGPGWLLVSNGSIFSEPVGVAYALGSGMLLLVARCVFGGASIANALAPLAILGGLTLHARPHLAVGYYVGLCVMAGFVAWRGTTPARVRAGLAVAILGLFGALLLVSNALRFHNPAMMHGSFSKGEVTYGFVYLGVESEDSVRAMGFSRYGQFNAERILPSALIYTFMPPPVDPLMQLRRDATSAYRGWGGAVRSVRVEEPQIGILLLWPAMMVLMVLGLAQRSIWRMPQSPAMLAIAIGSGLLLSYGTLTLRYHVDLWPLIALPALFGVAPMASYFDRQTARVRMVVGGILMAAVVLGAWMTINTADAYSRNFIEKPGIWTREYCLRRIADKGFSEARRGELCAVSYEPVARAGD